MGTWLVAASAALRSSGLLAGLAVALLAIWLAQTVPERMELEPRPRPLWWWGTALALGAGFGWQVTEVAESGTLLPAFLAFGGATLALGLIDLDHQLIPNRLLFPSLAVAGGLLVAGALLEGEGGGLLRSVAGALAYFSILLVIAVAARGGFGMGDVKLALLLGLFLAFVGWSELLLGAVLAILLGGVASVVLLIFTRRGRHAKFAYGPYLVAGAWIALLWGEQILDWYLGRSG
jgi:leader peptidase (prepilin peptidase)/N-methyltransferase